MSQTPFIQAFKGIKPEIKESAFIAQTAVLIGDVRIHENASIWYNTVLRGDIAKIEVGENSNIQDGTVVHVDVDTPCIVGKNVTVGHGAIIHACEIQDNVRIGMGAIILNGAVIEEGAQVGAGALVPPGKRIKSKALYVGVPATKIRECSEKDLGDMQYNAKAYVELSKEFVKNL